MQARIYFTVETGYIQTGFDHLSKLGEYKWVNGKCVWRFPLEAIADAEALIGQPIEFNELTARVVSERAPMRREQIDVPEFKGKGHMTVEELPQVFVITEYRKIETPEGRIEVKEIKHEIPSENVAAMRDALDSIEEKRYKDGRISCRKLAEETCKICGVLDRYTRDSGSFAWNKFFGERSDYFHYYYLPLKVLVHYKEVIHHKNGEITKLQRYI